MSEFYMWVNVDKKEYIAPNEFGLGIRGIESMNRGNALLSALYDLLSKEWEGDRIFWMGENCDIEDTENETLNIIYEHTVQFGYPGDAFDTVCDSYKNMAGLYKAAEMNVRQELWYFLKDVRNNVPDIRNEYGVNIERPYDGLFLRQGQNFKYILNHSRKVCYCFESTKILYSNNTESDWIDPLPLLMAYGAKIRTGSWLGDIIGVANEKPQGYGLLDSIQAIY